MAWLRTGLAVTALAAVAWAGGCGSAETDSSETVGRLIVDEDTGKPIPDVSLAQQLQEAFADPRRYPFTIAVCPLQTDFWDAQEKTPCSTRPSTTRSTSPATTCRTIGGGSPRRAGRRTPTSTASR